MKMEFRPEDIQGNIVRGYNMHYVRHLILEVTDLGAARKFLAASAAGDDSNVPAITREVNWDEKPKSCFNIGVTFEGLRALGLPETHLASFPKEFIEGMTKRALKIGDFGDAAPEHWPAPFDTPERVHIVASIHSDSLEEMDHVQESVATAFSVIGVREGRNLAKSKVIFGYTDSISQPKLAHVNDPTQANNTELVDPLGTILLGYPTRLEGVRFSMPTPEKELGVNGTFNAFRILSQDAAGFEDYLTEAAEFLIKHKDGEILLPEGQEKRIGAKLSRKAALREIVAAQMLGRWRNGTPYETSPDTPNPKPKVSLTNFNYTHKSRCPVGAHMRRCNPRGGPIVQHVANNTRRLMRRGMTYGPDFNPKKPDNEERGLLGNFLGANIGAQFEAVMYDWLNLGLQHPAVTGSNDPLLGANSRETSWFDMHLPDGGRIRLRGFPRFVLPRGGAYTFLPSVRAIKYLAEL